MSKPENQPVVVDLARVIDLEARLEASQKRNRELEAELEQLRARRQAEEAHW